MLLRCTSPGALEKRKDISSPLVLPRSLASRGSMANKKERKEKLQEYFQVVAHSSGPHLTHQPNWRAPSGHVLSLPHPCRRWTPSHPSSLLAPSLVGSYCALLARHSSPRLTLSHTPFLLAPLPLMIHTAVYDKVNRHHSFLLSFLCFQSRISPLVVTPRCPVCQM